MSKIQFLGAAGEVTGSSFLLTNNNHSLLVDLGLFQGSPDLEKFNFLPLKFDVLSLKNVLLTHAHLDHCGRLPLLIKSGFKGKIYTTYATKAITEISLLDSAKIEAEDKNKPVLYTVEDVEKTISKMETVDYDSPIRIDNFMVTFRDAGHILGSASIEITDFNSHTFVFSGDLGNSPQDLIRPTEYIKSADFVVMESTYGDKVHPQQDVALVLQKEINMVELSGGTLLIPAFSIERTQEILHQIGYLKENGQVKAQTIVFLDSPMAIEVTDVFGNFISICNDQLQSENDPFNFTNLRRIKTTQESRDILNVKEPKVIIAGSGMLSGGRILNHLVNYISLSTTRLLIVGYQAEGTLGRLILEGAKEITIRDQKIPVQATVTFLESLSSHADQPKLIKWLKSIQRIKRVFLVHGEDSQRTVLRQKIIYDTGIKEVILPAKDQIIEVN